MCDYVDEHGNFDVEAQLTDLIETLSGVIKLEGEIDAELYDEDTGEGYDPDAFIEVQLDAVVERIKERIKLLVAEERKLFSKGPAG